MSEVEVEMEASSSNEVVEEVSKDELAEPEAKRRKLSKNERNSSDKLENRLGGILCCAVCLDLPRAAVYQCANGHLMCAGCFTHLLADSRLRDETATCPNCRVEISKDSASRNLAVENAISELPSECKFCSKEFSRNILERHQDTLCDERLMTCEYSCIGCPWRGPQHERAAHEASCLHPRKSGAEVMLALQATDRTHLQDKQMLDTLFQLLSFEKITFNDLQFKPYRTEEYVNRLFYETSRFSAFNNQWVVKANINKSQRDPTQSSERDIAYQIILKSKPQCPLPLHYVILRGPFGDMRASPRIYQFEFNERDSESTPTILPLPDTSECNRLLANKTINFRLIMFLISK